MKCWWAVLGVVGWTALVSARTDCPSGVWRQRVWVTMGTRLAVRVLAPTSKQADAALEEVIEAVQTVDRTLTLYDPQSELWHLNRRAGQGPVRVSSLLLDVIQRALHWSRITHGAFDFTVGPLVRLWGFLKGPPREPPPEAIQAALRRVGYDHVNVDPQRQTVTLQVPGMVLDFGAIAKGYALDRAVAVLRTQGIHHALINLGGDLFALGASDGCRRPWPVRIQHPRKPQAIWTTIQVQDAAVATSGDYGRYFEVHGRRYSHILSPHTGRPLETRTVSVTMVAPSATEADALATAFFIMGPEKARTLLQPQSCRFALWIQQREGHLIARPGPYWPPPVRCTPPPE